MLVIECRTCIHNTVSYRQSKHKHSLYQFGRHKHISASLESAISTSSTQPLEHPVSALLGDEMLVKLRSVYAELDQQLQSAQLTESSKNEFVSRVQSLNPDSWLAGEEVILRIEKFDSEVAAIQGLLSNA